MTDKQIISWIFLATALAAGTQPANINDISLMADGINHAVPTQKELQMSIAWLIKKELILKQGKFYQLTAKGKLEYEAASLEADTIFKIWKALEKRFMENENN